MQVAAEPRGPLGCPRCAHECSEKSVACARCGADLFAAPPTLGDSEPSAASRAPPTLGDSDLAALRGAPQTQADGAPVPAASTGDIGGARPDSDGGPRGLLEGDAEIALDKVIDDRYRLLAKLGEGGMGTVYRVEHVRMGKVMALKVLRPEIAKKRTAVERFKREAKVVSRLNHPNAITVFDCGATPSGLLYIAMEYVPGRDLSSILREETRLDERRALKLTVQLLKGLAQAHTAGIIHRDVKAANVMLMKSREDGELVKILDFGIAKLAETDREEQGRITGGADILGTPSGMSPEQARGLPLDARSDVYSATALLFELLTGRPPFTGAALEVVSQHLVAPVPSLRSVLPGVPFSEALEAVIAKGLAKDAALRYQSADEMRAAVEVVLGAPVSSISSEEVLNIARREDWDSFERSFRIRHTFKRALALVLFGTAVALLARAYHENEPRPVERVPVATEIEPNEKPRWATLIAAKQPVKGHIGTRSSPNFSDRDVFELNVMQESVLSLEVTSVPNVNLVVEVFSEPAAGETEAPAIAALDDAPTSMSEELTDLSVRPGRYLVRLSDKRRLDESDGPPRENNSDPYTLVVSLDPPRMFQEREPNNEAHEAMVVSTAMPVLGRAGTPGIVGAVRIGPAPLPTWAVDLYRLSSAPPGSNVCAVLGGLRWSSLRLTAFAAKDKGKLKSLGSVQVREGRAGGVCVKASDSLLFEVRVDVGNTGPATYPIAFVHDQAGGFAGLELLVKLLPTLDRAPEARLLIERTLELLPKSQNVAALREILSRVPQGESSSVVAP